MKFTINENNLKKEEEPTPSYVFDIRYKSPRSDELYKLRRDPQSDYSEIIASSGSRNPFSELNGKPIMKDYQEVGRIYVTEKLFPQCLVNDDGARGCGFFFKVSVEITSENIDADTAFKLAQEVIEPNKIDYM